MSARRPPRVPLQPVNPDELVSLAERIATAVFVAGHPAGMGAFGKAPVLAVLRVLRESGVRACRDQAAAARTYTDVQLPLDFDEVA